MSSGNKRVSQLVELTANETQLDDLFLVIDSSARESKRMQSSQLAAWLTMSGSLSVSHATTADTASYISISNVVGTINSASYANRSTTASYAHIASQSISASYAGTSSYAINSNAGTTLFTASLYPITSSWAVNAVSTTLAQSASFLRYLGVSNGTASYALTTQNVNHATTADSASYFNNPFHPVATASFAEKSALCDNAGTASFLAYSPNNGTASYAIRAGNIDNNFSDFGIFLAITQSTSRSFLDNVGIISYLTNNATSSIEAMGNVKVPFTASVPISGLVKLIAVKRISGEEIFMDSSSIDVNISPIIATWGAYATGTISFPFSLMGQSPMSGSYSVYVSSSNNVYLEPNRTVRFNISSKSDSVSVGVAEPLQFSYTPASTLIGFSSSLGGQFNDNNVNILGSGSNNILWVDMNNTLIYSVRYLWTLPNLRGYVNKNNTLLSVDGLPASASYFDCRVGTINSIYDMSGVRSMSYFDCAFNNLSSLPSLPQTMSYFNCSTNPLTTLPNTMPFGLYKFICDDVDLLSVSSTFPNSVVSMSLNDNGLLSSFFSALPTSLQYISLNYSPVGSIPSIPASTTQLFFYSASLSSTSIDTICATLVANGASNGRLDIRGNGTPSVAALTNIAILQGAGWTVQYDP